MLSNEELKIEILDIINKIKELIRERSLTDIRMSGAWILVIILSPFLMFLAGLLVAIASESLSPYFIDHKILLKNIFSLSSISINFNSSTGFAGFELLIILSILISGILLAVLYYRLISRMNMHFRRSSRLREEIVNLTSILTKIKGSNTQDLSFLKTMHSELKYREQPKSVGLHSILSVIIPFYWLYVAYFLTNDWQEHELREREFFKSAISLLRSLDVKVPTIYWEEMPRRSAGLYLILTIVLGGLFGIYWLWTLIKDPDKHFISHVKLEDTLIDSLEELSKAISTTT